jgi:hypothetical protein
MTTAFKFKDDHGKKLQRKADHEKALMANEGINSDSQISTVNSLSKKRVNSLGKKDHSLGKKDRLLTIKDNVYNQIDRFEDTLKQAKTFKTTEGFPAIHLAQGAGGFRY